MNLTEDFIVVSIIYICTYYYMYTLSIIIVLCNSVPYYVNANIEKAAWKYFKYILYVITSWGLA